MSENNSVDNSLSYHEIQVSDSDDLTREYNALDKSFSYIDARKSLGASFRGTGQSDDDASDIDNVAFDRHAVIAESSDDENSDQEELYKTLDGNPIIISSFEDDNSVLGDSAHNNTGNPEEVEDSFIQNVRKPLTFKRNRIIDSSSDEDDDNRQELVKSEGSTHGGDVINDLSSSNDSDVQEVTAEYKTAELGSDNMVNSSVNNDGNPQELNKTNQSDIFDRSAEGVDHQEIDNTHRATFDDAIINISSDDEDSPNKEPVVPALDVPKVQHEGDLSYDGAVTELKIQAIVGKMAEKKQQYSQVKAALKNVVTAQLPDGGERLRSRLKSLASEIFALETEAATISSLRDAAGPTLVPGPNGDGSPVAGRAIPGPSFARPEIPGPSFAQPEISGPSFARPEISGPSFARPEIPGPAAPGPSVARPVVPNWSNIKNTTDIQHGFGAKAMQSYNVERDAAMSTLSEMHRAIQSRPDEAAMADQPRGLRNNVLLMPHQRRALAWLSWRESLESKGPTGGILADDMGLGKTLTMISLMLLHEQDSLSEDDDDDDDAQVWTTKSHAKKSVKGGTLVVCPASLLNQWEGEVKKRVKSDRIKVEVHHGAMREKRGYRLARANMVVTTYAIVRTEHACKGALHQVRWKRIVLDEAHVVRNHKSKTAEAVFNLTGRFRWCLTGTPVHNKELDLFALIKFIGCDPFDDVGVWKRWIDNKAKNGAERLHLMLGSLLLRRTKAQLQATEELQDLAEKHFEVINVALTEAETQVYEKIMHFSKSMFAKFLQQRHEREAKQNGVANYTPLNLKNLHEEAAFEPGSKLSKMADKYASMDNIEAHVILVLLLRLRQICVHPSMVVSMLDTPDLEPAGDEEADDLAGAMGNLTVRDRSKHEDNDEEEEKYVDDEIWNPSNPVFDEKSLSSKMRAIFKTLLSEKVALGPDKAVVVSQWVSMLNLLEKALDQEGVPCVKLCGDTKIPDRMKMVDDFNNPRSKLKVMLLSLTAGGVGLNLVGANHLLLCDLHWNPQMEAQACDRVYRVGQDKPVHIYKFICKETIEETIDALQKKKMALATDLLTGARDSQASKLSMDDLKMLFQM